MAISMYEASAPVLTRYLGNLSNILEKGAAFCADRKIDDTVLTQARLFPNMFPLARQVQIASDMSKGAVARLSGAEPPSWPDEEKTFAELRARIGKTLDYIGSIPAEQLNGSEDRRISLKVGPNQLEFAGREYLLGFVLPNVFFHITAAYAILRENGVELGKRDFLGG